MSQDENLSAAFALVGGKLKAVQPRLLPGGGTTGQALVKTGDGDNAVGWVTISGGSGGADITPTDNIWTGSNTFSGTVALNGTATAVTAAKGTNNEQIATTKYAMSVAADTAMFYALQMASKADKNNTVLTGYATAPTADPGNTDEQIANCEFVANEIGAVSPRLVPPNGKPGQLLTRDTSGSLTWTNAPAAVGFYCSGKLANAEVMGRIHAAQTFTIVAANCKVTSDAAATASATVTIKKNGTAIGTAVFAASATTATVSITTAAVTKGDLITFHAPDTADTTLANVSGTISN